MPEIQEGLTEGFPDVNRDDGFVQALASKVGEEVPEETLRELRDSDTNVLSALQREPAPTPQSAEPVAEEETPEVPEEGETPEEQTADPVQEYISQHGGTPEQAITALYDELQNAQQLIGRHSAEVGEKRQLEQRLAQLEQFLTQPQQEKFDTPLPVGAPSEEMEEFFESRGPQSAMQWIVENRPDLIEEGIEVWKGYDEVGATRFATRYDRFLDEETAAPPQQIQVPAGDPFLEQMKAEAAFQQAVETARVASNLEGEEWESVKQHVIPVLEDPETSPIIKMAVSQPRSAEEQVEGIKSLMSLARQRVQAESIETARAEQARQSAERKQAARVATGSLTPPQKGQSGEEEGNREEAIKSFKESILAAESTDVAAGLTYGNKS